MLHIRNTLHKQKYLENDTLSRLLHNCVLRVILHPERPSLLSETVIYILNQAVPKIAISPSSFFLSFFQAGYTLSRKKSGVSVQVTTI